MKSIHIASPGWIELLGKLNPFTFIKDCIEIVRDWGTTRERTRLENERLRLENERLRIENKQRRKTTSTEAMRAAWEVERLQLENERVRLENERARLAVEAEAHTKGIEARIREQKLVAEKLKNLDQAGVSKSAQRRLIEAFVLKPLGDLQQMTALGKITGAKVA